jgi:hypothetical protein
MPTTNYYPPKRDHEARADAIRARRAARPTMPEVTVTAGEIRPGDFLVRIPSQSNVRGVRAETTVTAVTPDDTWVERGAGRSRFPIAAVRLTLARGADVSVPSAFPAVIRRAVTA